MLPRRWAADMGEGEKWLCVLSRRVLRRSATMESGVW
jgi:hypothetical protein